MMLVVWPDGASRLATREEAEALLKVRSGLAVHEIDDAQWTGKYLATAPHPTHPRPGLKESARGWGWGLR